MAKERFFEEITLKWGKLKLFPLGVQHILAGSRGPLDMVNQLWGRYSLCCLGATV